MTGQVLELPVKATIVAAWEKTEGAKKTFWAGIGIMFVILFCIGMLEGITETFTAVSGIFKVTGNILGYFLQLSLIYMGITRAKELPINFKMIFFTFKLDTALHLIGLYILQTLIFLIPAAFGMFGFMLFNMGGTFLIILGSLICIASFLATIYIAISLSLSMAFLLDTAAGPLASIKRSFLSTRHNFWRLGATYLSVFIAIIVCAIPLIATLALDLHVALKVLGCIIFFAGLIWALPLSMICYGLIYKQLRNNAV